MAAAAQLHRRAQQSQQLSSLPPWQQYIIAANCTARWVLGCLAACGGWDHANHTVAGQRKCPACTACVCKASWQLRQAVEKVQGEDANNWCHWGRRGRSRTRRKGWNQGETARTKHQHYADARGRLTAGGLPAARRRPWRPNHRAWSCCSCFSPRTASPRWLWVGSASFQDSSSAFISASAAAWHGTAAGSRACDAEEPVAPCTAAATAAALCSTQGKLPPPCRLG